MTDDEDETLADRLAAMGIDAGEWADELERRCDEGVPVDHLIEEAVRMRQDVQQVAAEVSGRNLYNVTLRFDRILAKDQESAIEEAKAGRGHLADIRAEQVYVSAYDSQRFKGKVRIRPLRGDAGPEVPDTGAVDAGEFLRVFRDLCIDPTTGEVDLPDHVIVSYELRDALVRDKPLDVIDPGPELGFLDFPVSFAEHDKLKRMSGTDEHVLVYDRRRRSGEPVEVREDRGDDWDLAVYRSVEA